VIAGPNPRHFRMSSLEKEQVRPVGTVVAAVARA
jgi:hypothetical protein